VIADFFKGQAVPRDVGEETRAVLTAIRSILEQSRLDMDCIVQTNLRLTSLDDFDIMDAACWEFFGNDRYQARTATESSRLFGGSLMQATCMLRLSVG
jgi:2-iminobutanoate/2-iminopropanoate deaminase